MEGMSIVENVRIDDKQLATLIDHYRACRVNKNVLQKEPYYLDATTMEIEDGPIIYCEGSARIDGLFIKGEESRLVVFLQGARTGERESCYPDYSRWSYYTATKSCILSLADPMYYRYPEVRCGWYLGNEVEDYRLYVSNMIKIICKKMGICESNVLLFGSSAGGTAAVGVSQYFENVMTVAINPQLDFTIFLKEHIRDIKKYANVDLLAGDKLGRNDILSPVFNSDRMYLFIFNMQSKDDYLGHYKYLCEKMGEQREYGFKSLRDGLVSTWVYSVDRVMQRKNHAAVDNKFIFRFIEFICEKLRKKSLEDINALIEIINSYWSTIYENSADRVLARVTLKNEGGTMNNLEVLYSSDSNMTFSLAEWMDLSSGKIYCLQSDKKLLHLVVKCIKGGELFISLGNRPNGEAIVFTSCLVNQVEMLDFNVECSFKNAEVLHIGVKNMEIIDIRLSWECV